MNTKYNTRKIINLSFFLSLLIGILIYFSGCKEKSGTNEPIIEQPEFLSDVALWLTLADQTVLMTKQQTELNFGTESNNYVTIEVDSAITYQTIDGFGFTLTGGSARLINQLDSDTKDDLLTELFSIDSNAIGISYLRISMGASDLSDEVFTYNEMPANQIDMELKYFSIEKEQTHLIPILKKILSINPNIKIMGSPWTAPTWMKTNTSFMGGSLKPEYYDVYSNYFVKYIEAMANEGIVIDAVTIQNEPLHAGNNPSMYMEAIDQALFIKNHLGPLFESNGIKTKIIVYDHNADRPDYPITILNDPEAAKYIDGSAFHLYGGNISALTQVHNAYPDKNLYFTEQWVGGPSIFGSDLSWHMENLIIGATRNWSTVVLEWNLASDPSYFPHTEGGCINCLGAITVGNRVSRNVAYYIIAHASKFVRPGAVRISSSLNDNLKNVAFKTADGQKVLIVLNTSDDTESFNIKYNSKWVTTSQKSGSVGTYVWK